MFRISFDEIKLCDQFGKISRRNIGYRLETHQAVSDVFVSVRGLCSTSASIKFVGGWDDHGVTSAKIARDSGLHIL